MQHTWVETQEASAVGDGSSNNVEDVKYNTINLIYVRDCIWHLEMCCSDPFVNQKQSSQVAGCLVLTTGKNDEIKLIYLLTVCRLLTKDQQSIISAILLFSNHRPKKHIIHWHSSQAFTWNHLVIHKERILSIQSVCTANQIFSNMTRMLCNVWLPA